MKKLILALTLAVFSSGVFSQTEVAAGGAAEGDTGAPPKPAAPSIKTIVKIVGAVVVAAVVASASSPSTTHH